MKIDQTKILLDTIAAIDGRAFDDDMVALWAGLLDGINPQDAMTAVGDHFRNYPDKRIQPGHVRAGALKLTQERFNRSKAVDQFRSTQRYRTSCGRPDCQCTHDEPCEAGWIENEHGRVRACANCRADVVAVAKAAGSDRIRFQATIRNKDAREAAQQVHGWD